MSHDFATESLILQGSPSFGQTGSTMSVYNPVDNVTLVGEVATAALLHIELIERAAEQGFQRFRKTSIEERARILKRLADAIRQHRKALALLITQEVGKPITMALQEVDRAIRVCEGYAAQLDTASDTIYRRDDYEGRLSLVPIGSVLAITPYNFPVNLVMHKLAPAIASGCSITIKPAPQAPLCALFLGRLAVEAGATAVSVIPASNAVAEALVSSPVFRKISFTGSASVGWHLRQLASQKEFTLELGGNAALIVEDLTQPLHQLAARVAHGAFAYAGQTCVSVQRVLVHERLYNEFYPALIAATRAIKVGDPMRADTEVGPMIDIDNVQRARTLIKHALRDGANVIYGGNTFNAYTLNPTILDRTTPAMAVEAEEVFAPILTLSTYATLENAITRVNASRFGLQAGLYSNNETQITQAFDQLDVGGLVINDVPGFRSDFLPYGGVKDSGTGREGVLAGLDAYTVPKVLIRR